MSSKPRVTTRLKQAMGSPSTNKSSDLISATNNYDVMKKRLKLLIQAVKNHHEAIIEVHRTRNETVKLIGVLSLNTPLFEHAGALGKSEANVGSVESYAAVHSDLSTQNKVFDDRYAKFIVDYVVEWERIITSRLSSGLKKEQQLRMELDHYQRKVEGIRTSANVTLAKGKMVDPKTAEKLSRNEEKLLNSRTEYEKFKNALCVLIDEATLRSWKDLHPLLLKMIQFDVTVASCETKFFTKLNSVMDSLKIFAEQNGITGESRLSSLENMDAYELSGTTEKEVLAIENGNYATMNNTGISTGAAQPNWQGMQMNANTSTMGMQNGGAPQASWNYGAPNSSNGIGQYQFQNQPGFGNDNMSMMTNAAPAPTFDSLSDATRNMTLNSYEHSKNYSDPFAAAPVPGVPTAPPPQMPPPPPPGQAGLSFSHQSSNQQQFNQLTVSNNPSSGYNYDNALGVQSPTSAGAASINSQENAFAMPKSQEGAFSKNPFDSF